MPTFEACEHIAMDGTFKKVPAQFYQLYTIHGLIEGSFKPMLFALLTRKTQVIYERLLRMIRAIAPCFNPLTVSIDFERAAINAVQAVFPGKFVLFEVYFWNLDAHIQCCFFHFGQAVYRQIQSRGMAANYNSNLSFNRCCKMLVGLAFLPLNKVKGGFRSICRAIEQEGNFPAAMPQFLEYFARTYVGTDTLGGGEK